MNFEPYLNDATPWATTPIADVEPQAADAHRRWTASGAHGSMTYMERYDSVRSHPQELLPGARTMLIAAFPYFTTERMLLPFALYARGRDYHEVVRQRLEAVAAMIPGDCRVCVDTAPLRERYWAARAGLGFIGRNNQLIVNSLGSYYFLGTILTTAALPIECHAPEPSVTDTCGRCRRCLEACPGHALSDGAAVDARRCLSYLTIEHRGDFPEGTDLHGCLYGCDVCQRVCPHNAVAKPTPIADFHPSEELCRLNAETLSRFTAQEFNALFRHSAVKRTKLSGLLRNLRQLSK
jgi:epoxyqueuosine reductase